MNKALKELLDEWYIEYNRLKEELYVIGDKGDSVKYNLYSTEALRLQQCINDVLMVIIENSLGEEK
jgi:hypothetical protein